MTKKQEGSVADVAESETIVAPGAADLTQEERDIIDRSVVNVPRMNLASAATGEDDDMLDSGILGYSEESEDSMVPVLAILQDNSGEVKKKHDRYIDGAEAGDFIIRSLQRIFKQGERLLFQPCGFSHEWVEWTGEPGEGGAPVAQYPFKEKPPQAEEVVNKDGKTEWRMPETGNRLVDTRHHYGNIVIGPEEIIPVVIPMSGTNHSTSRQWTALMKQFNAPGRSQKAPSFFRKYNLTNKFVQRGTQSWYKYSVADAGWVDDKALVRNGFSFAQAVAANQVRAGIDADADTPVEDADAPI